MEPRLMRRPLNDLLSSQRQYLLALNTPTRRHESSYRRTRSRLNVKPAPSFLLSKDSPKRDHIIFNPPSAAPSVLHTPLKFLPKDDPRVSLFALTQRHHERASASASTTPSLLPPPVRPKFLELPRNHLSEADIREMQRLKKQDPDTWSSAKLARKFNCSYGFVITAMAALGGDTSARDAALKAKAEAQQARWGPRKRKAIEDRKRRYEAALRDE